MYSGDGAQLSLWRLCCRLWHRGLSLWQPAVPPVDAGSSHWQHLPVLVSMPHEYTCWVFDEYTRINILTHGPETKWPICFYIDHRHILTYDFICISILSLSLEIPLCTYHSSYEHYLYRCVFGISILLLLLLLLLLLFLLLPNHRQKVGSENPYVFVFKCVYITCRLLISIYDLNIKVIFRF